MTASARLRLPVLRETNGATAMSAAPNRLAPTAAHVSIEPSPASSPESTGATANANVPTPVAKNPAASSRSIARPSTRNRVAASTATIEAVIATEVSSAMRAFGSA